LTIVGIFVFSLILSGCGKLGKKDFEGWRDGYVAENNQTHSELRNQDSNLDSKVEAQDTALRAKIDEDTEKAKEDAIAAAQLGDADSIQAAKKFDDALRSELTKAAEAAGQKAQDFAKSEDDGIRKLISDLDSQASSQSSSISGLQSALESAKSDAANMKQKKPMRVATIHFDSGRGSLSQAAKQELDKAITEIQNHADFIVKVVGHADGRPVLGGMYRSNWDLSQARADAAAKYLQGQGVANEIESIGRGHTEPVASAKTADGREKNRRVEVILYPPGTLR
ncbi:OmpA family protein, partial [Candidatus Poribacteria bacterium]|nr:OmpA family protein [Candidatus Poribacteria bacterium]